MNLVITGLLYLYWIYSENTAEVEALLQSPYLSVLNDTKFYIGLCLACLYFGFLMSYEKVLYLITIALTAIIVFLYIEELSKPKEVSEEPLAKMQEIIEQIQKMRAESAAGAPMESAAGARAESAAGAPMESATE